MVRLKNRYLLLDILYPGPSTRPNNSKSASPQLSIHAPTPGTLTPGLLAKMVREEVSALFGDWGVGKLGGANAGGINVKYLSPATSTAIIRCPRAAFRLVWTALTYMSYVPDYQEQPDKRSGGKRPCVFRVLRVSGTMRKAEEEAIRRARREIVRARGLEERDVLGELVGGAIGKDSAGLVGVDVDIMDESEDEMVGDDED